MNQRKAITAIITVLVLAGLAVGGWYVAGNNKQVAVATPTPSPMATTSPTPQSSSSSTLGVTTTASAHSVTYSGQTGKTALELLQAHYPDTQMSGTGTNAYVTAINGYTADTAKHEYWELTVNGTAATVGAGSLQTKNSDVITWVIATY